MNSTIAFFVGSVTFVLMLVIKLPVKKFTRQVADSLAEIPRERYRIYRRCNISLIILTMIVAITCYCLVLMALQETHFKFCCTLKAGAIATALYAVFEQWFGEDGTALSRENESDITK